MRRRRTEVFRRPLLIVPPWINKFYVLDLNPQKSFVRWAVEQGLTVFVISWVNPDERHADKGFEAYMREGILAALDAIEQATGERDVATIGYCVGGTLLAITLAYMAAKGEQRISSATFFTAQVDFRDAGDLKVFADEEQIQALEAQMAETGYLKGSKMANAFNMLRPNELIWSFVVNNYLKGKAPMAFDLLAWNSDSTRMPAANHAFYLRNCYLGNKLTEGEMVIGGETLDLGRVDDPGLQPRDPRGPHRAGAVGLHRREVLRRPDALRAGRVRAHRRRGQSAGQAEISILVGPAGRGQLRGLARREPTETCRQLVARLAGLARARRLPTRSRPGSRERASSRPCATRRANTSACSPEGRSRAAGRPRPRTVSAGLGRTERLRARVADVPTRICAPKPFGARDTISWVSGEVVHSIR